MKYERGGGGGGGVQFDFPEKTTLKKPSLIRFNFWFEIFFFSLEINIFLIMGFLENVLEFSLKRELVYSHQSLAEELGGCVFNKNSKFFVVEENCHALPHEISERRQSYLSVSEAAVQKCSP